MSKEQKLPIAELDLKTLEETANKSAMQGAISVIESFYTDYNSPYKKAIRENLENKGVGGCKFDLPDVIAAINEQLMVEVDQIANTAIAKTFIPMVKEFLTRAKPEITLSELLQEFIEHTDFRYNAQYNDVHPDDYSMELTQRWPDSDCLKEHYLLSISDSKNSYKIDLKKQEDGTYQIDGLPENKNDVSHNHSSSNKQMKISVDGVTLEMPFIKGILNDGFVKYGAQLLMAKTKITFDVNDFSDDLFPESSCHC